MRSPAAARTRVGFDTQARPIIVENDYNTDLDDFRGLRTALEMGRRGYIAPLVVVSDSLGDYTAAAASVIIDDAGQTANIKVGAYQGANPTNPPASGHMTDMDVSIRSMTTSFPHTQGQVSGGAVENAVTTVRRALAARTSADVVYYIGGFLTLFKAILQSPADGISGLTGSQLVAASVKRVVLCAGVWALQSGAANSGEYNVLGDPVAANYVLANCPVPIRIVGIEIGNNVVSGTALRDQATDADPLRWLANQQGYINGRDSWDSLGQILATADDPLDFGMVEIPGTATTDATTGASTWTYGGAEPHALLKPRQPASYYVGLCDACEVKNSTAAITKIALPTPICDWDFSLLAGNDGDAITTVPDQSGNGHTLTVGSGLTAPILKKAANGINSLNVARFNGTTSGLSATAGSPFITGADLTVFMVLRRMGTAAGTQRLLSLVYSGASDHDNIGSIVPLLHNGDGTIGSFYDNVGVNATVASTAIGTATLMESQFFTGDDASGFTSLGGEGRYYTLNRNNEGTPGTYMFTSSRTPAMNLAVQDVRVCHSKFSGSPNGWLQADVGRVIIYNAMLSIAKRKQIAAALKATWGL